MNEDEENPMGPMIYRRRNLFLEREKEKQIDEST